MLRKTYEKITLTDDESIDDESNQPDMNDDENYQSDDEDVVIVT